MTEYFVIQFEDGRWVVESTDWNGETHRTIFLHGIRSVEGPFQSSRMEVLAGLGLPDEPEAAARAYAAHMNRVNSKHISFPDE